MQRRSDDRRSLAAPGGFTLIEMLVATTLVVLMMLLFAQIYLAAIRSLNTQQAIARNDQRMRATDQVLRSDLLRGSFREVPGSRGIVPLVNGDAVHSMQKGYFYLSENEPANPVDDVLQFTMLISPESRQHDQTPFYGRCIGDAYPNGMTNHPDDDDGIPQNNVGMSRAAEVSYFVRGGNLYRRMLLLRDPLLGAYQRSYQPLNSSGNPFTADELADEYRGVGSYYQRYDYAAYGYPSGSGLRFLGLSALDNYGVPGTLTPSMGLSQYRFGFDHTTGMSREFDSAGLFFGRMTHAETGSVFCVWPASANYYMNDSNASVTVASPNPMASGAISYDTTTNQLTVGGNLLFDSTRVNEDLLVNNIESFDVEVWDPGVRAFIQLGQSTSLVGFNAAARLNSSYGPNTDPAKNWVFDTGHPGMWNDNPAIAATAGKVAYRPKHFWLVEDTNDNGVLDSGEDLNGNGVLDPSPAIPLAFRAHVHRKSAVYRSGTEDTNGNGSLDTGEDVNGNGVLDTLPDVVIVMRPGGNTQSIAYRCIRSGEDRNGNGSLDAAEADSNSNGQLDPSEDVNNNGRFDVAEDLSGYGIDNDGNLQYGVSGLNEPVWPLTPGAQFDDGTVTWESFDNRIGLEMIRITIRTRDTTTGTPRQFSLVHSFVEPPRGE